MNNVLHDCIKLSCMCASLRDGNPSSAKRTPPQPGILLVTTGNRLGVNELIEPPGAAPETQPKLAGLAQTENTLTPTKTALISPAAWLHRSLTRSSLTMKPTEAMGAGGRGYGCEPPGTAPPHSTPHKLEGRTE